MRKIKSELKESSLEETQISNMVEKMADSMAPEELALTLVDGIMEGIAESRYGSDERFYNALKISLKKYDL